VQQDWEPKVRRWLIAGPSVLILALVIFGGEPITQASQSPAGRTAAKLLNDVPLPRGTRPVPHLASELLQHPATSFSCAPLVDKSRLLVISGSTLRRVHTFLTSHHPAGWTLNGSGSSVVGNTSVFNVDYLPSATRMPKDQLVVTYGGLGKGKVAMRVDAEVAQRDARCTYSLPTIRRSNR